MKKKRIWIFGGVLLFAILIAAFILYRESPYTYVKEERVINYALKGSRSDFELLHTYLDDENRTIEYEILSSEVAETDQYFIIANRTNEYLEKHTDYFLNEGFRISLCFVSNSSGAPAIVRISNWNTDKTENDVRVMDRLGYVRVWNNSELSGFWMGDMEDISLYENIRAVILDKGVYINDLSVFLSFPKLEYFRFYARLSDEDKVYYNSYSDEEVSRIRELLPTCEILAVSIEE